MIDVLVLNDIEPGKYRKHYNQTIAELANGEFTQAEVKKMAGTPFYRAKLDYSNRLLFRFCRYNNKTYLLILEIILNHEYEKSRFLRGTAIVENKLIPLKNLAELPAEDYLALPYLNNHLPHFHVLDKVLSFDDNQEELLSLPMPQIIIGSAGSGKSVLTLEKIKDLSGKVLYVTHSSYLAEYASRLFYSNNYENENLEIDFLSYKEFLETIRIPERKELDYKAFEKWFAGYKHSTRLKDAHKTFEEFRGVITGLDVSKEFLSREDYLTLGIKQSIFLNDERETVYSLFLKYLEFLKKNDLYDINIYTHSLLPECTSNYDFIIVDEVQDFANIQLMIILKSLKNQANFILCGDANQVVHPTFFSWSHLKTLFYQGTIEGLEITILHTNYRNSQAVSLLANRLLKIKNARFGSIDKESNYLVRTAAGTQGEVIFLEEKSKAVSELAIKTRRSVNYAILVLRNEDKGKARSLFPSPLLFSIQESKGLEYENIIIYNFISDNPSEFKVICNDVNETDLLADDLVYSRGKDKSDKSHDVYKFYINSLYVAITRAVKNIYIIEQSKGHKIIRLLGISEVIQSTVIKEDISSPDDWKREARRLEMQGKTEQADAIRKDILTVETPPWEPITMERYLALMKEALDPDKFNKKAKDKLFDFVLLQNQFFIIEKLAGLQYKRAEHFESERGSLFRKYYQNYKEDKLKLILPNLNKYGIDYRDSQNFTPLHAAAYSGAVGICKALLENGANPDLLDTFNKTALQIALGQAFAIPDFAKSKLGKIYPLLLTDSLKIQVDGKLIKIDTNKIEYLLINLFIVIQPNIIQVKRHYQAPGCNVDDLIDNIEHFSDTILPSFRKKRTYLLSVFAKHEVNSNNPYNKKIFFRISRGHYLLNLKLLIWNNEQWMPVSDLVKIHGVSGEELVKHSIEKEKQEMAAWQKKYEKDQRRFERRYPRE